MRPPLQRQRQLRRQRPLRQQLQRQRVQPLQQVPRLSLPHQ